MPVSDDTKLGLEQVKKGKTRKFVMLTKGTSIISLVIYKKGAPTKYIKEAKESGKGTPCFGVLEGGGLELIVKLAATDGFKDAPVKDLILKKYLEDEADFKCKPRFELVDALPIVLDETDELHARFLKLQERAVECCDSYPDRAEEIGTLCRQTGGFLDADQRDKATDKLEALEDLLNSLNKATDDKAKVSYEALRAKLEPLLAKVAGKAAPDKLASFSKIWEYAGSQAFDGKYSNANKALAGLADAVMKLLAAPSGSSTSTPQKPTSPTPTKPSATTGDDGNDDADDGKSNEEAAAEFLARWQGAREMWRRAIETTDAQMEKLRLELRNSDDGDLWEIAEFGLNGVTKNRKVPLQVAMLDMEQAAPERIFVMAMRTLKLVDEFAAHLAKDGRVAACDANPYGVPVSLRSSLGGALKVMSSVLKTAA